MKTLKVLLTFVVCLGAWLAVMGAGVIEDPRPSNAGWVQGPHKTGLAPTTQPLVLGAKGADGGMEYLNSVSGALSVNGTVGGTVSVTIPDGGLPVSGPLTDTQLRATAVPVSGPLTDTQLRATAVPVSGPLTDTQLRATAVPVSGPATNAEMRATPIEVEIKDYTSSTPGVNIPDIGAVFEARSWTRTNYECCATNSAGGTACTALTAGTYAVRIENLGPNPVFCTINGDTPTTSTGVHLAGFGGAATDPVDFTRERALMTGTAIKCLALTAAQTTPSCVHIVGEGH